ncbi:MAG: hypothetical protein NTZ38_03770 [Candidatus Taylorbacteria bacterium]|nr:hypothetical protein [Candidatus Taylorbacteria bacterium]
MKISTNLDSKSEKAFHDGRESFLVLHAAVNLLLYRGLKYCFAIRGMVLLPKQMEITGSIADILVTTTEDNQHITIYSEVWNEALKQCSRATISFFVKSVSEPEKGQGLKEPRFCAQIRLFEKQKGRSFFRVDMILIQVRTPSFFFEEKGPNYCLDGSLKWEK